MYGVRISNIEEAKELALKYTRFKKILKDLIYHGKGEIRTEWAGEIISADKLIPIIQMEIQDLGIALKHLGVNLEED